MTTPEGVVKEAINAVLDGYPESYVFKSVPYGYGASTLDYLMCHYELFISIEAKRPGEKPTARQQFIIRQIKSAWGKHFTVDGVDSLADLSAYLEQVKQDALRSRKSQAQSTGRTPERGDLEFIPHCQEDDLWGEPASDPAAPTDGNISAKGHGLRRPKPDIDPL